MSITVYVPCDSGAISLGADSVATAIQQQAQQRGLEINLVRNDKALNFSCFFSVSGLLLQ